MVAVTMAVTRMVVMVMVAVVWLGICDAAAVNNNARLCVPPEMAECDELARATSGIVTCTAARDSIECLRKLQEGEADLGYFVAEDLNVASTFFKDMLEAVLQVEPPSPDVARVHMLVYNESNPQPKTLCHPGFDPQRLFPPALHRPPTPTQRDVILNIESHIAALEGGWEGACIPGQWSADPETDRSLKRAHPSLCSSCLGSSCDGDASAISCLLRHHAEAAIVSDLDLASERARNPDVEALHHLCPDGTIRPLGGRAGGDEPCDWGTRPSSVILARQCHDQECQVRRDMWVSSLVSHKVHALHALLLPNPPATSLTPTPAHPTPTAILQQGGYTTGTQPQPSSPARFCVRDPQELAKCLDLAMAAQAYGVATGVSCVQDLSDPRCYEDIYLQKADVLALDGGDVYQVTHDFGFDRLLTEVYNVSSGTPTSSYYAVAVVRAESNITQFSHLQGRKSCHTGLGKTAGWKMPVATLQDKGLIDPVHCNYIKAVAEFFSGGSCAPGANNPKYNKQLNYQEELCRLCAGTDTDKCARGTAEPFYSYAGAFRCLVHGGGDVAFVKHSTVPDHTDGHSAEQWAQGLHSDQYRLLCPSGGTAAVTEYQSCNLALVPAHEVVVSGQMSTSRKAEVSEVLLTLAKIFGGQAPGTRTFRLFGKYEGQSDLLFKDSAVGLKHLSQDTLEERQRKDEYFRKLTELHSCDVRVCALEGELDDCEAMARDMAQDGRHFVCVSARDRLDCVRRVKKGQVDLTPIPGSYLGIDKYRLVAQMRDPRITTQEFRYKAVMVVRRAGIKRVADLRGKKSCHTGYGRTTGWRIPVALLKRAGVISPPCNQGHSALEHEIAAVATTFNRACIPGEWSTNSFLDGALKSKYSAMCSMCHGNTCDGNDEYAGYNGALRCLTEKNGDVAFSKLKVVRDFFQDRWAADANDFGLLCPDDRVVAIDDDQAAEDCYWAARPWDAYITHQSTSDVKARNLHWALTLARIKGEENLDARTWYKTTLGIKEAFTDIIGMPDYLDTEQYYGKSKMDVVEAEEMCIERPVRFCVTKDKEERKCNDLQEVLTLRGVSPPLQCIRGESHEQCLQLINRNKADIMSLTDVQRFRAQQTFNLVSLLTEHYGEAEDSLFYLLAVVKKTSGINTVQDLTGKTSCQKPINATSAGQIDFDLKDCISGTSDFYTDYKDAIKCLVADNKDVAFVKHSTSDPLDIPHDGPTSYYDPSNFQLLCSNGVAPLDKFSMKQCNLGHVPADVIVTRQSESPQRKDEMRHLLFNAASYFGKSSSFFRLFYEYFSTKDLLFRDGTTKLMSLTDDHYQMFVDEMLKQSCGLYKHHVHSSPWHTD